MKKLLVLLVVIASNAFGQNNTLWLTNEYVETTDSTNAILKRKVNSYNEDHTINVTDYRTTGEKHFEGTVLYINWGFPINDFKFYFKNGKIRFEGRQTVSTSNGFTVKEYYENGQLRCEYEGSRNRYRFVQSFDSIGVNLLQNGNGVVSFTVDHDYQIWSGKVKNFKMDSIWIAKDTRTNHVIHAEHFVHGGFVKGFTTLNGQTIKYTKENGSAKPAFVKKIRDLAIVEIRRQVPKGELEPMYKVGIIFKEGKPVQIVHFRKTLEEREVKFENLEIPNYTFIEKGIPIESLSLGLEFKIY
jgi:antitoxin component YwqK of YwqJK toxin-antitoxin module